MSSEAQGAILDAISEVFEPVISQVKKVRGIHPSANLKTTNFTGKKQKMRNTKLFMKRQYQILNTKQNINERYV